MTPVVLMGVVFFRSQPSNLGREELHVVFEIQHELQLPVFCGLVGPRPLSLIVKRCCCGQR